MKQSKVLLALLIVSILVVALVAGCSSGTKTETANQKTTKSTVEKKAEKSTLAELSEADKNYTVKLGYYKCDHMVAARVAYDAGIFDELGVKVQITGNGNVPQAMAAGQMDVGYVGTEDLMRAYLLGSPIMIAANNHLGGGYYLVASNKYKTAKDLVGKRVALGANCEQNNSFWIQMANQLGIPAEGKNYKNYDMDIKNKYLALKMGQMDGFITCDPWGSMAEYEKTGHILGACIKLPNGEWRSDCVFSLNKNFTKEHPELAKRMILAHIKALEIAYAKPVTAAEFIAKDFDIPVEVALRALHKKTNTEGRTLTWNIDPDMKNFKNEIDYELKVGVTDKAPDIKDFIQPQLLNESGGDDFDTFIKEKVDPVFPEGMPYEEWSKKAYEVEGEKPS